MTGYAKRQCATGDRKYTVEIKTLNSKMLELSLKAPASLRHKELELRAMLARLERGKVECYVTCERGGGQHAVNAALVRERYEALRALMSEMGQQVDTAALMRAVLGQGDVWQPVDDEPLQQGDWETIKTCMDEAIEECDAFRKQEGEALLRDFEMRATLIEERLRAIPPYEAERMETVRARLRKDLGTAVPGAGYDANRFEQELIYYLEKLDITEEKVRLAKHIDYFRETLASPQANGKKLGFIAQEMGREINTTGSKANHVQIQRLVVEMKDELEKIKEQLANIL